MKARSVRAEHLDHTKAFAREFFDALLADGPAKKKAIVIGLYGELGAGKTTFTKEVARLFGIKRPVSSPTFVLERVYALAEKFPFRKLIHIDAYRLKSGAELVHLGWQELIADPGNLIFIEWPEKVEAAMPKNHIRIFFTHEGMMERTIALRLQ